MELQRLRVRRPLDFVPVSESILDETIIPQFERIVELHPDHDAIRSATQNLTYRQLNNAVNQLARQIDEASGADRSPIAILLDQEIPVIVALLGAAKTGRPYITLYPGHPDEALRSFIQDSTAGLLVTSTALSASAQKMLPKDHPPRLMLLDELQSTARVPNPGLRFGANDPSSIYYTSGSTGQPKGVLDGHLTATFNAYCHVQGFLLAPSDRVSLLFSTWHRAGLTVIYSALAAGSTLCMFDVARHGAQAALDWLEREAISIFWSMTSTTRSVFGAMPRGRLYPALRIVRVGGEPITGEDLELIRAHTAPDCAINLSYASSEAGEVCEFTVYHDTPAIHGTVPVGFPLPESDVLILDDEDRILTAGEEGEVCVSSPYMSLGYWNNPELTARVFCPHPRDASRRICHTGDLGRLRQDGALEVYGRKDTQVKLRGFRMQLELVDTALRGIEGVQDAATIVEKVPGKVDRLVAYVAFMPGKRLSNSELRGVVSACLPSYMVPAVFVELESLPRTGSGKLSRQELPKPSGRRPELETAYVAPRNELEGKIESVWESVLGLSGVGMNDSFFELGGDSLMTLEMTLQVERELGRGVPSDFFKAPTIASLAELMGRAQPGVVTHEGFVLASHGKDRERTRVRSRRRSATPSLRKVARQAHSARDPNRLIDLIVARHVVNTPFPEAREWSVRWSRNPFVARVLYRSRFELFTRFVGSLPASQVSAAETFPLNVLTNLSFNLTRYLGNTSEKTSTPLESLKTSTYAYWHTLGELLEVGGGGPLSQYFCFKGKDILLRALGEGKGVILVTFHGGPSTAKMLPLERLLGLEPIDTISYHTPRRLSRYDGRQTNLSGEVASSLNAQVALFGQRRLQEGKIIQVLSDTTDFQGRTYGLPVGDRLYEFKAGFAEMALNTGATVIPYWRYFLPDASLQQEFGEPFDHGTGERGARVERLLRQYAAFLERTWAAHPEAVRWKKMIWHLKKPGRELSA